MTAGTAPDPAPPRPIAPPVGALVGRERELAMLRAALAAALAGGDVEQLERAALVAPGLRQGAHGIEVANVGPRVGRLGRRCGGAPLRVLAWPHGRTIPGRAVAVRS